MHRRSFLAACAVPGAANLLGDSPEIAGPVYLATLPEWGLRPGSGEDQSKGFQALIDTVSERGGGTILLPPEHGGEENSHDETRLRRHQVVQLRSVRQSAGRRKDARARGNAPEPGMSPCLLRCYCAAGGAGGHSVALLRPVPALGLGLAVAAMLVLLVSSIPLPTAQGLSRRLTPSSRGGTLPPNGFQSHGGGP